MLFVSISPKATEQAKENARQRMAEARTKALAPEASAGGDVGFGALAIRYSEDQSTRYRGGDIGWFTEQAVGDRVLEQPLIQVLYQLSESNRISSVVETARGLYLIKFIEGRPAIVKPFESLRPEIHHKLLIDDRKRIEAEWRAELRTGRQIQVFTQALEQAITPSPTPDKSVSPPPMLPR